MTEWWVLVVMSTQFILPGTYLNEDDCRKMLNRINDKALTCAMVTTKPPSYETLYPGDDGYRYPCGPNHDQICQLGPSK